MSNQAWDEMRERRQSGRRESDFLKWKELGRDKGLELIAYDLDLGRDNPSGEFLFVCSKRVRSA